MIKITNKIQKSLTMKGENILFGSYFLGQIGNKSIQLYFASRIGIVSLETSQEYFKDYHGIVVDYFKYVDIEVTTKAFTEVV